MAAGADFFDRRRFARRPGAVAALIIVHAVLEGSGWILAGELGLLSSIAIALAVEAKLARHREDNRGLDRSDPVKGGRDAVAIAHGSNDAPAHKRADLGVALGVAGTAVRARSENRPRASVRGCHTLGAARERAHYATVGSMIGTNRTETR